MKIHEYQAKQLFRGSGIPCPEGHLVTTPAAIDALAPKLTPGVWVVKSQIHAGGRGKGRISLDGVDTGGGVRVTTSPEAAIAAAQSMLGGTLVTVQTGPAGKQVNRVLVEGGVDIASEFYLAAILDRETANVAIMASTEGGTEIEEVARETPEKIHTVRIDPLLGYRAYHGRVLGLKMGFQGDVLKQFVVLVGNLYKLFVGKDCSLAEINPLVLTGQDQLVAIDGKLNFDDNGLYRQADVLGLRDIGEEEPLEVEAAEFQLNYIKLDGNIGCLVNGAGLAMATMDIIKAFGGEPANFLDVGGTATPENVARSFRIMLRDQVAGIFVNVFGGIVRCDVVAQGLVEALGEVQLEIPLVVRLEGNRKDEAIALLAKSGLPIITADNMKDGAMKIVSACQANS
jgi:succinyl-CoA synthetase beta subunit